MRYDVHMFYSLWNTIHRDVMKTTLNVMYGNKLGLSFLLCEHNSFRSWTQAVTCVLVFSCKSGFIVQDGIYWTPSSQIWVTNTWRYMKRLLMPWLFRDADTATPAHSEPAYTKSRLQASQPAGTLFSVRRPKCTFTSRPLLLFTIDAAA